MSNDIKTYKELIKFSTFEERFKYLKLDGVVGDESFGSYRYLNQKFYTSTEWKRLRDYIISRDNGNDLGIEGYSIMYRPLIHHIVPITKEDIIKVSSRLVDPDNLITVSHKTHNAIHYGDEEILNYGLNCRSKNDTILWKKSSY